MVLQVNRGMAADEQANERASVQYRLSFRQAETHRVDIEMSVPTDGKNEIELMMPVWTPGSYLVREYARQVEQVSAYNGLNQQELGIRKSDKNHWIVACGSASEVVVRYSLYCREMSVRTNWVERDFAFLTGAATFLTRSDMLDHPHLVRIDALPNWPHIATSLPELEARDTWTRIASNFDELVDSPIVLGTIDIKSFECGGAVHHLATLGGEPFWDTESAVQDVTKIVETEQKLWNDVPYREYWFLNLATESGGGLEHDNCCVLMTGRWAQRQKSKYLDWLGLVSHEFFHTWNVRRLRPKVLMQYDYNTEQYTQELWVAEGITSYYDDLIVARAGLFKPKEYLDRVSKSIASVQSAPGRLVQSLRDSSFDSWIKFYRPDENSANSRVSYYVKGCIVGFLLDAKTREVTNNAGSLDDVMRLLYQRHSGPKGFSETEFASIVSEVAGTDMTGWLAQHVETADELDYQQAINWFGLHFSPQDSASDKSTDSGDSNEATEPDATEPDAQAKTDAKDSGDDTTKTAPAKKPSPWLGVTTSEGSGPLVITGVIAGSPAVLAGLNVDDELLAFNQYRASSKSWKDQLKQLGTAEAIQVLISRRGIVRTLEVTLVPEPTQKWQLKPIAKPTDEQKSRLANWLGK